MSPCTGSRVKANYQGTVSWVGPWIQSFRIRDLWISETHFLPTSVKQNLVSIHSSNCWTKCELYPRKLLNASHLLSPGTPYFHLLHDLPILWNTPPVRLFSHTKYTKDVPRPAGKLGIFQSNTIFLFWHSQPFHREWWFPPIICAFTFSCAVFYRCV